MTRHVRPTLAELKARGPFGRWTPLSLQYEEHGSHRTLARCRCECGTVKVVRAASLLDGQSRSCGCLAEERCAEMGRANAGRVRRDLQSAAHKAKMKMAKRAALENIRNKPKANGDADWEEWDETASTGVEKWQRTVN